MREITYCNVVTAEKFKYTTTKNKKKHSDNL